MLVALIAITAVIAIWQRLNSVRDLERLQIAQARARDAYEQFDSYVIAARNERNVLHERADKLNAALKEHDEQLEAKSFELVHKILELRQAERIMEKLTNQVADHEQKAIEGRTATLALTNDNEQLRKKLARAETDLIDAQHLINKLEATVARRNQQLQNATNLALGYTYRATPALNPSTGE